MATKTASLVLTGDGLRFEATSGSGHTIVLDDGKGDTAMRPAELIPIAVAGCTAMDVVSILRKKRQPMTAYEVRASGHQVDDHPNNFTSVHVVHVIEGEGVDPDAVFRAVQLSATKYCSVGATLSSGDVEVHHGYALRTAAGEGPVVEVLVTGPRQSPAELAAMAAPREAAAAG